MCMVRRVDVVGAPCTITSSTYYEQSQYNNMLLANGDSFAMKFSIH